MKFINWERKGNFNNYCCAFMFVLSGHNTLVY